jgi:3-deoxy-7-phosphoheptulonate synthase
MTRTVPIGGVEVGGDRFLLAAGPCAIESHDQLLTIAREVRRLGASAVRGGVFKMRTDPRSFQGLGPAALPFVDQVREETGLPFIAEITSPEQVETFAGHVDVLQVGSRNMHNTALLKELGRARTPVLLKRGLAARLDEWLLAAEYIVAGGNEAIVLCERGIRTFETETRNTLDLAGAVWARQRSPFPVLVDPSHATGQPDLVAPMCLAAAAAGLDGVMVEVHHESFRALSDGFQALSLERFSGLVAALGPLLATLGRRL